jgi:hypothetical protein
LDVVEEDGWFWNGGGGGGSALSAEIDATVEGEEEAFGVPGVDHGGDSRIE